jgi:hypothetical protein
MKDGSANRLTAGVCKHIIFQLKRIPNAETKICNLIITRKAMPQRPISQNEKSALGVLHRPRNFVVIKQKETAVWMWLSLFGVRPVFVCHLIKKR